MKEKSNKFSEKCSFSLVIASYNIHKIRELKNILRERFSFLDILTLKDFPNCSLPEETGSSFKENAIQKAVHVAKSLNYWTLSDDTGLIVPALGGEPGILSARYAGKDASDCDNRKKLLVKMEHLQEEDRFAYYECCVVLASPNGLVKKCASATVEGSILREEKGGEGFGYDSLFLKHDYNKTFAELNESLKNKISHRRKALDKMMNIFDSLTVN